MSVSANDERLNDVLVGGFNMYTLRNWNQPRTTLTTPVRP
jgi:hypothetical protein